MGPRREQGLVKSHVVIVSTRDPGCQLRVQDVRKSDLLSAPGGVEFREVDDDGQESETGVAVCGDETLALGAGHRLTHYHSVALQIHMTNPMIGEVGTDLIRLLTG